MKRVRDSCILEQYQGSDHCPIMLLLNNEREADEDMEKGNQEDPVQENIEESREEARNSEDSGEKEEKE